MVKEILILPSTSKQAKFSIRLDFKDEEELNGVIKALQPLGYSFRKPER